MKNNKTKRNIALLLCIIVVMGLMTAAYTAMRDEEIEDAGTSRYTPRLLYQGMEYPLKRHIQTILLIGTDGEEKYQENADELSAYYNYTQADFLMLMVFDLEMKSAQLIQLNRDTMTEVPWLDVFGEVGGTEYKQLCLAFNYGDGGANSCKNTVSAVSKLLFGAPIDRYIQIPMSAIGTINDLVGGVPVTIEEDLTMVDPAFVKGATVRLNAKQAESFVRSRMGLTDDTNIARMRRQRAYMESFRECAKDVYYSDPEFPQRVLEGMEEFWQSSLTAQQMLDLIVRLDQFAVGEICHPDGELKEGEQYYEFYVDEESLWNLVKRAYCE